MATGLPFPVTTTRSWVAATSSRTLLNCAFTAARDCVVMTRTTVRKTRGGNGGAEHLDTHACASEAPARALCHRRDARAGGHGKALRLLDPVLEFYSEDLGPFVVGLTGAVSMLVSGGWTPAVPRRSLRGSKLPCS